MGLYSDISGDIYTNLDGYKALYQECSDWLPCVSQLLDVGTPGTCTAKDVDVRNMENGGIRIEFCDTYMNLTKFLEAGIEALFDADPDADVDVMDVCTDGMKAADKWVTGEGGLVHQSIR